VIGARAFIPWDAAQQRFAYEAPVVFPLATRLYDHPRFEAARKTGKVAEAGPVKVDLKDRLVRALDLQPSPDDPARQAQLTYPNLWIPDGATFQAWVAIHPRLFNHKDVGTVHVEVRVGDTVVADQVLDPSERAQQVYTPLEADLSAHGGQRADVTLRVWPTDPTAKEAFDVLIGEPRLSMP
jgi:hypothetical protein